MDIAIIIDNIKFRPVLSDNECCATACPLFNRKPICTRHRFRAEICRSVEAQLIQDRYGSLVGMDERTAKKILQKHIVWQSVTRSTKHE